MRWPSGYRLEIDLFPVALRGMPLSAAEPAALERDYRSGSTRLLRQRSHIVLLEYELDSQEAIARVGPPEELGTIVRDRIAA